MTDFCEEEWQKLNDMQKADWENDDGVALARKRFEHEEKLRESARQRQEAAKRQEYEETWVLDWDQYVFRKRNSPADEHDEDPKLENIDAVYRDEDGFAVDCRGRQHGSADYIPHFPLSKRGGLVRRCGSREDVNSVLDSSSDCPLARYHVCPAAHRGRRFSSVISGPGRTFSFNTSMNSSEDQENTFGASRFNQSQVFFRKNFSISEVPERKKIPDDYVWPYYKNFQVPHKPFKIPVMTNKEKEEELEKNRNCYNSALARLLPWYRKKPLKKPDGMVIPFRRSTGLFPITDELHMEKLRKLAEEERLMELEDVE